MTYQPDDPFSDAEIRERVKMGVAKLDEYYEHWEIPLDVMTLDMTSVSACVLGQMDGDEQYGSGRSSYHHMRGLLFADWTGDEHESSEAHGFDAREGNHIEEEYRALDREWVSWIMERQNT